MQFVSRGADIPDALLQDHEDGRVVFFCGAGISYPAGLPGFAGLVDQIYDRVGTTRDVIEDQAYNRGHFDATLDLLERRVPGHRLRIRKAVAEILKPNLRPKGATDTHAALLHLGRCRDNALRLVTTNFDRVFQRVGKKMKVDLPIFSAPMLPIPKNSRWNGLVHIHGLLPEHDEPTALQRLVLTSGDFGSAYLTERWAARFVTELFRNYTVCFVGYSINDPVLRYMMDALAADRLLGEWTPEAYAFAHYSAGQEKAATLEWKAKGVTPILYEVPSGTNDHAALHGTLKRWGETYRDGVGGKERIVLEYAMSRPATSTPQDDFVGRMLWALSHASALPARRFAEFNPVPTLEWLTPLSEKRFKHSDLIRFGVAPSAEVDEKLRFSLIDRPAPYSRSPWMLLASGGARYSDWDDVMYQLGRWLARHLGDPALILWFAREGGRLHSIVHHQIEDELNRIVELEIQGDGATLAALKLNAPHAIPRPELRALWRYFLNGRIRSSWSEPNFYRWQTQYLQEGLTISVRIGLRILLEPQIAIKAAFGLPWMKMGDSKDLPLRELIEWELVLAGEYLLSSFSDLRRGGSWAAVLPILLDDLELLLLDGMALLSELGEANARTDRSFWDMPSISAHAQNRGFHDWTLLIELVRDAWVSTYERDRQLAAAIAERWFALPHLVFKRLALFAAAHANVISNEQWIGWLLEDGAWLLWSVESQREMARLAFSRGYSLDTTQQSRFENAILAGPPRAMYREDISDADFREIVDRAVWFRLSKLKASGLRLSKRGQTQFDHLSDEHPTWELARDERDEFSHWMSVGEELETERAQSDLPSLPTTEELVPWLKEQPAPTPFQPDSWSELCRNQSRDCMLALVDLAKENIWRAHQWSAALQAWSADEFLAVSWNALAPVILEMPADVLSEIGHSVTWWLEAASKSSNGDDALYLALARRILSLPHTEGIDSGDPVTRAINHPVGHTTQALLNLWFKRGPNDNDELPDDLKALFTQISDPANPGLQHGRVLLASRLISFFRVDRKWTEMHLLPLLDWDKDTREAKGAWTGFMWAPRLHRPLLVAFKREFFATVRHYVDLGEHRRQFIGFLTYAALSPVETYNDEDFRQAYACLPQSGLNETAATLALALESAGDQREEYWTNRVAVFLHRIWPKAQDLASEPIAEHLARLSIAAGGQFPSALTTVMDWLRPLAHPHIIVHLLGKSGLCGKFPDAALTLLDAITAEQGFPSPDFRPCIDSIVSSAPHLGNDVRYRRLDEYLRRHGR